MHRPEGRIIIQHGRNDRRDADCGVGHVDGFGHDEGDRAHHRRHDLTAHRRGRLDRAGEIARIAVALHQRNGELADRHDIGDAGAVDRAHHAGGDDGHLGRSAAGVADRAHRDIGEQSNHAGALKEGAEQDEQEDVGRGDVDRNAVDAFGAEEHLIDDLAEIVAAGIERARQILAEQAIGQKDRADDRQQRSHHAAAGLEHQHDDDDADHDVGPVRIAGAQDQVVVENPVIEAEHEAANADRPID